MCVCVWGGGHTSANHKHNFKERLPRYAGQPCVSAQDVREDDSRCVAHKRDGGGDDGDDGGYSEGDGGDVGDVTPPPCH